MFKISLLSVSTILLLVVAVCAQTPDLTTPEVQGLKAEAVTQRAEIVKQHTDALRKLIDDQLESSRQSLSKAKISGNITATAAGTAAVRIFSDVKTAFEKDGSVSVPGKTRTDLEATVAEFKGNVDAIDEKQAAALKKLNKAFAAKLGEILTHQKTPVADEAKLLDLWTSLCVASTPANTNTAAAVSAPTTTGTNTTAAAQPPAAAAVLQSHGDTANWTPLVKLEVTVHDAIEIVSVPLSGLTAPKTLNGTGGMGNPWQVQATPYQELVPGNSTPAFRIQSVPPLRPLDVALWPEARNTWTIDLRAKADKIPSQHAIILEVDAAACKPLSGGAPTPPSPTAAAAPSTPALRAAAYTPPAATLKVRLESQPEGAWILVNNQPLTELNKPLTTPCDYTFASANPVDITFRKRGYKDAVLRQSVPASDKLFHVTLTEAIGFADVTVPVSAAASTAWTPTGVQVKKGHQIRIVAPGTWSCGSDGEMVDADGYPNNEAYGKYYMDPLQNPRLSTKANYGQLLARILPDGEIVALGKQGVFTASTDGEIALAINEALNARRDNRGTLKARILTNP